MNMAELELLRAQALTAGRLTGEARHSLHLAQAIWQRAGIDDHEGRLEVVRADPAGGRSGSGAGDRATRTEVIRVPARPVHHARAVGLAIAASIAADRSAFVAALGSRRRRGAAAAGWRGTRCGSV